MTELRRLDMDLVGRSHSSQMDSALFQKVATLHKHLLSEEKMLDTAEVRMSQTQKHLEFVAIHQQQHGGENEFGVVADLQQTTSCL